jgi:predicted GNAT family acetyltransferase
MSSEIAVRDRPEAGRYELTTGGETAGFVTYRLGPGVITFLHTEVDPAREGAGLASRLVAYALDDARSRGLTVRPMCPFVSAYIDRHPGYRDLLA